MATSTWQAGISPDRRVKPDRRIPPTVQCQETLARIVAETRGPDSHAAHALQELARRRAAEAVPGAGDDLLIIYALRGQWLVGPVREIRAAILAAAAAACRRGKPQPADAASATRPADTADIVAERRVAPH